MAFKQLPTTQSGSVVGSGSSYTINSGSPWSYSGGGSSQATLEGIAGGKVPFGTVATFGDVAYGFLDNFTGTYGTKINSTQGSLISTNWNMAAGESVYYTVSGDATKKDYISDVVWASVKYVGTNNSYNASLDQFSFSSKAIKLSTDADWSSQEVIKFTAPTAGNYQISVGITDGSDTAYNSAAIVSGGQVGTGAGVAGTVNELSLNYLKYFATPLIVGSVTPASPPLSTTSIITSVSGNQYNLNLGNTGAYQYGSSSYWASTNAGGLAKGGVSFEADGITLSTAGANAKDYEIEEFFGLTSGTLDQTALQKNTTWGTGSSAFYSNATAGAAYKQLVEVDGVGSTIEFDYKWDGGDYLPYNDFAAVFVGTKGVTNENSSLATLYNGSGSSQSKTSYTGSLLNGNGLTDKSLASVYGAGDYADVVGKFKYTIKDSDSLYSFGGKKYAMVGVAITDVNDEVVDSSIKISNIKSNKQTATFGGFTPPVFSGPSASALSSITTAKQGAIASTLANFKSDGNAAANKSALSQTLKGFDSNLIYGNSGIFNSSGISSAVTDTSIKSSLTNFDFSSLSALIKSGNIGDLKIDASVSVNFSANISSAALGLNTQVGGSVSLNTLVTAAGNSSTTYNSTDWSKVNFNGATTESKKTLDWSKVSVGTGANQVKAETLSSTDYLQATANGNTSTSYSSVDWKKVKTNELSSETLNKMDWKQVKFGEITTESKQTMDWSKVKVGSGANAVEATKLSTTDLLQTQIGTNTTVNYNTTDWSKVESKEFSSETYNKLDWSKVNLNGMTSESKKTLDWNKVKIGNVASEQKKSIDWSKVDINGTSKEKLTTTDKLQIAINGKYTEDSYKTTDWGKISYGEFSDETYAATDWSKVDVGDITTEKNSTLNWSKVKFGDVTTSSKKTMDWSQVKLASGQTNTTLDTTDKFQIEAADGTISTDIYNTTNWKEITTAEWTDTTYNTTDWSKVKMGDLTTESKKTMNWKLVDSKEFGKSQTKSTTDDLQITLVQGNSTVQSNTSKKTNWSKIDFGQLSSETYNAVNWGEVKMGGITTKQYSTIDWTKVQFGEMKSSQYKSTDWSSTSIYGSLQKEDYAEINWSEVTLAGAKSVNYDAVNWGNVFVKDNQGEVSKSSFGSKLNWNKVDIGDWSSENYSAANWGVVNYKGMTSETYNTVDWGKVQFGEYQNASYATTDWAKVQTNEFTSESYKGMNWSKVVYGGPKGLLDVEGYANLNFGLVLDNNTFGKKEAKKVDWTKVDATDLDAADIAELKGYGVNTATIGSKYVKPQQSPEAISFLGLQSAGSGATAPALNAGSTDAVVAALSGATVKKELQLV